MRLLATSLVSLLFFACKPSEESNLSISNGLDAQELFPSVVMLRMVDTTQTQRFKTCTGTFVAPKTILTAAHCLVGNVQPERPLTQITITGSGGKTFKVQGIERHPRYSRFTENQQKSSEFDVAIITTVEANPETVPGGLVIPPVNAELTLVGYGRPDLSQGAKTGTKRYGTNTVDATNEGRFKAGNIGTWISFSGVSSIQDAKSQNIAQGKQVVNLLGDSGGPMFYKNTLVGISAQSANGKKGLYTNLNHPENKRWLDAMVAKGIAIPRISDFSKAPQDIMKGGTQTPVDPGSIKDKKIHVGVLKGGNLIEYFVATDPNVTAVEYCVFANNKSECTASGKKLTEGLRVNWKPNPKRKYFMIDPKNNVGAFEFDKDKVYVRSLINKTEQVSERSFIVKKVGANSNGGPTPQVPPGSN